MLDLETLDTALTSQVLSIGACKFSDKGILDSFYVNLKIREGSSLGFTTSKDTLKWWKEQASEAMQMAVINAVPYSEGVDMFLDWYGSYSMPTWSNGADFDIPIMKNHFVVLNKIQPWNFRDTRCYRTLNGLLGDVVPLQRTGVAHCARDDAISQANHVIAMLTE